MSGHCSKARLNRCADDADATDEGRSNQGLTVKIRCIRQIRESISFVLLLRINGFQKVSRHQSASAQVAGQCTTRVIESARNETTNETTGEPSIIDWEHSLLLVRKTLFFRFINGKGHYLVRGHRMLKSTVLRIWLLLALAAGLWLTNACRSQTPPTSQTSSPIQRERVIGKPGGTLRYRVAAPPQTFNYLQAADESSLLVAFYLLGGRLVEFDHDTYTYIPGLAESWKLTADARTLDLVLRAGLKFSDGQPLSAEDVVFTLTALYDERTAAPLFREAMLIGGRRIEAVATGPRQLRLNFPEPVAAPENYLSNLAVLPRQRLAAEFAQSGLRNAYNLSTDPPTIITAGPFVAAAATPGERITLRRNPHYWKRDAAGTTLPYLDSVIIEVVGDANNAFARLQQGALDVLDRLRPTDYAALRAQPGALQVPNALRVIDVGPGLNTDHLWFNLNTGVRNGKPIVNPVKRAWFSDVRFRRAISHALDRESIASVHLRGLATPLYHFVSPGNRAWAAQDLPQTKYDLAQARTLLESAGFVFHGTSAAPELFDAQGQRVEFTMLVPAESQPRVTMATVVQADLARLGINMQVAPLEFGELSRRVFQSFEYDAVLFGASVSEPDPSAYANLLRSSSPSHQWYPKQAQPATPWEARVDELLTAQARETDPARRRAHFHEIQTILAEQLPLIPLVTRHTTSAATARLGNYRPSALLPYSLWCAEDLFLRP
jgi:peptide/nickel transport system substrate-binding protein